MKNFYPYITNDGSVGLYSDEFDDIYHSTFGAYSEAWEKFILPADLDFYFKNYKEIKVLDICYGIGYNTKSLVQKYYNEAIGSNNILCKNLYIKAVDTDKELMFLSPFFTCCAKRKPKNQNLPTEKVKHLSSDKIEKLYKYDNFINFILIEKLAKKFPDFLPKDFLKKEYSAFFDKMSVSLYQNRIVDIPSNVIDALLHNIYYWNISRRYKKALNALKLTPFDIDYACDDARNVIKHDNKTYQLIFLDAFTPVKCPCLWSVDFFKLLYEHLDENGRILTYSNSAQVRNAFLAAGFFVGKIYNERAGKFTGTIAVKNKSFIKNELSEYDLSLMKTRAGIFYRDENLNGLNEAISERHKIEVENSQLISSSKFIKEYRKEHQNV